MTLAALDSGVPVGFGLITCDTPEQAWERAGGAAGNKGAEATAAALASARTLAALRAGGLTDGRRLHPGSHRPRHGDRLIPIRRELGISTFGVNLIALEPRPASAHPPPSRAGRGVHRARGHADARDRGRGARPRALRRDPRRAGAAPSAHEPRHRARAGHGARRLGRASRPGRRGLRVAGTTSRVDRPPDAVRYPTAICRA